MVKIMTSWSIMGNRLLVTASSWALPKTEVVSRQLGANQAAGAKSMEKLSSGLRINRAGDDAAGLAISEKMRGQIRGLKQAGRNAQDGISLIQTAEGALNETHSILQRMRELAVQSANDTNTDTDRTEIQKEIDELAKELTRISNNTEFNTRNLLNGGIKTGALGSATFHIGANQGQSLSLEINAMDAATLGVARDLTVSNDDGTAATLTVDGLTVTASTNDDAYNDFTLTVADGTTEGIAVDYSGKTIAITLDSTNNSTTDISTLTVTESGTNPGIGSFTFSGAAGTATATTTGTTAGGADDTTTKLLSSAATFAGGVKTADAVVEGGIDVSTQAAADSAISVIQEAIDTVSAERSKLGVYQNRLERTIANLGTSTENLQAAESRIRDVDMAEEMMAFTKFQILQQASTAMLAQANMAPQSVLQLLG